jgi:hypothetical protein
MSYFEKIKHIKCTNESCHNTIEDVFEGDEDNELLDCIRENWYCSQECYGEEVGEE